MRVLNEGIFNKLFAKKNINYEEINAKVKQIAQENMNNDEKVIDDVIKYIKKLCRDNKVKHTNPNLFEGGTTYATKGSAINSFIIEVFPDSDLEDSEFDVEFFSKEVDKYIREKHNINNASVDFGDGDEGCVYVDFKYSIDSKNESVGTIFESVSFI